MALRDPHRSRFLWAALILFVLVPMVMVRRTARTAVSGRPPRLSRDLRAAFQEARQAGPQPLPVYGRVPAFALTDQDGQPVTPAMWQGRVWIADFIFTRCAGQCVMMSSQMTALQRALPEVVALVSITVDPDYDTPPVLAAYAARSGADTTRWRFLTGPREAIYALAHDGFRLSVAAEGGTPQEPILHSVRLVLVDGDGQIRGYYDATETDAVARLARDAQQLLAVTTAP